MAPAASRLALPADPALAQQVGQRVAALRDKQTPQKFARLCGISPWMVVAVERGERITESVLNKIAGATGMPVEDLLGSEQALEAITRGEIGSAVPVVPRPVGEPLPGGGAEDPSIVDHKILFDMARTVRGLRKKQTQEKFARRCGISTATLALVESGTFATAKTLSLIAARCGATLEAIVGTATVPALQADRKAIALERDTPAPLPESFEPGMVEPEVYQILVDNLRMLIGESGLTLTAFAAKVGVNAGTIYQAQKEYVSAATLRAISNATGWSIRSILQGHSHLMAALNSSRRAITTCAVGYGNKRVEEPGPAPDVDDEPAAPDGGPPRPPEPPEDDLGSEMPGGGSGPSGVRSAVPADPGPPAPVAAPPEGAGAEDGLDAERAAVIQIGREALGGEDFEMVLQETLGRGDLEGVKAGDIRALWIAVIEAARKKPQARIPGEHTCDQPLENVQEVAAGYGAAHRKERVFAERGRAILEERGLADEPWPDGDPGEAAQARRSDRVLETQERLEAAQHEKNQAQRAYIRALEEVVEAQAAALHARRLHDD